MNPLVIRQKLKFNALNRNRIGPSVLQGFTIEAINTNSVRKIQSKKCDEQEWWHCQLDRAEFVLQDALIYDTVVNKSCLSKVSAKRTKYTGCPKSPDHLRNLNISTISLNFINIFFFQIIGEYTEFLFIRTTFHTTLRNYHL